MPDSRRLTLSTCAAWSSIERLRCRTPRPPWRAIAIAMRDSVTVSIARESSGVATRMRRVRREDVSASLGMTSVWPGQQHDVVVGESDEAERVGLVHGFPLRMTSWM